MCVMLALKIWVVLCGFHFFPDMLWGSAMFYGPYIGVRNKNHLDIWLSDLNHISEWLVRENNFETSADVMSVLKNVCTNLIWCYYTFNQATLRKLSVIGLLRGDHLLGIELEGMQYCFLISLYVNFLDHLSVFLLPAWHFMKFFLA